MKFKPYPYQIATAKAWYKDICTPGVNPLVALPTASGKSIILGLIVKKYLQDYPHNEVLILSHTKEILKQDEIVLHDFLPNHAVGIYSAGLGEKIKEQVTLGGIQSVVNAADKFKWVNLIIVDEAHCVNHKAEGNYRKILDQSQATIAGMSATIFRMGHGYLHTGKTRLFNKLSYDYTSLEKFNELVLGGYLCKLIPINPNTKLDSSKVKKSAGDYNLKALAQTHDQTGITNAAIKDALFYGKNSKSWLVFAIDIEHCEHICAALNKEGIHAKYIHSRMDADRAQIIEDFKAGKFKAIVSVGVLTVGFDAPNIDLILLLRPTLSAVLHIQMIGRGLRIAPNKPHCLVLDYAGNLGRLGPINEIIVPKTKIEGTGEAPTKTCPDCKTITHPKSKVCDTCGHVFTFKIKLTTKPSLNRVVAGLSDKGIHWLEVKEVRYKVHFKVGSPPSLQVTYFCGVHSVKEWWTIEHNGYPGRKAAHMLGYRGYNGPLTTAAVYAAKDTLKKPKKILVDFKYKYPSITNAQF